MNTDILQYRANAQAPWQAIPAIKGEKGDPGPQGPKGADGTMSFSDLTEEQRASLKGETGEQGPKGDSGVWRGSETPPANYDVWLDPSGTNTLSAIASVAIDNNRYIVITFENGSTVRSTNQVPLQDTGIDITIVESLPQVGVAKTIYMVLRTQAFLDDYYDEYMWVNNKWEIVGSTRLDLSDYYTKSEVDSAIASAVAEGGTEYTAGPGIEISSENEISTTWNKYSVLAEMLGVSNKDSWTAASSMEDFMKGLREGKKMNRTLSGAESYALYDTYGITRIYVVYPYTASRPVEIYESRSEFYNNLASKPWYCLLIDDHTIVASWASPDYFKSLMQYIPYNNATSGLAAITVKGALDELATKIPSLATIQTAGIVKPDGTSITIDSNGVISSQGGGGSSSLPTDPSTDGSYKLVNTVATVEGTQTATQSWQEDAGYTAGSGISIDNTTKEISSEYNDMLAYTLSSPVDQDLWAISRTQGVSQAINISQVETSLKKYGIANLAKQITTGDLYNMGYASCWVYGNYDSTTGTFSSGTNYTPTEGGTTGIPALVLYVQKLQNGTARLVGWTKGYSMTYWSRRKLFDCLLYKKNFSSITLSADGTLPNIINAIDTSLSNRVPSALVSTDTAPTTNNTINWVYK